MTNSVKIIYKNKDAIIILKPAGMPSQSDPSGDTDAMTVTEALLREAGERSSLWLVHRLDRTVGGLIAFARNKKSAAELSRLAASGDMEKKYFAVCHGVPEDGEYRDYLYKDNATSKSYIVKTARAGAKEAILHSKSLSVSEDGNLSLVSVLLETGRFHQIRAQFAARSHSLVGDKKYGSRDTMAKKPALFAYSLAFELFGKKISARHLPPTEEYPWSLFSESVYKEK